MQLKSAGGSGKTHDARGVNWCLHRLPSGAALGMAATQPGDRDRRLNVLCRPRGAGGVAMSDLHGGNGTDPVGAPDPFDPASLRLSQDPLAGYWWPEFRPPVRFLIESPLKVSSKDLLLALGDEGRQ
jgi:hypothetical protein